MELSCYCSVDAKSRFILGMHSNYDDEADPFKINKDAAMFGDMALPEAFREHAQYWLVGDELKAGRAWPASISYGGMIWSGRFEFV